MCVFLLGRCRAKPSSARVQGYPSVHFLFEKVERQRAVPQQFIVKSANIEFRPERLLGLRSNRRDLELADFIAEGLSGNGDITVHFESRAAFAT